MSGGISGYNPYSNLGKPNPGQSKVKTKITPESNMNVPQKADTRSGEDNIFPSKLAHVDYSQNVNAKLTTLNPSSASGVSGVSGSSFSTALINLFNSYERSYASYSREYDTLVEFKKKAEENPNDEYLQEQYSNQLKVVQEEKNNVIFAEEDLRRML